MAKVGLGFAGIFRLRGEIPRGFGCVLEPVQAKINVELFGVSSEQYLMNRKPCNEPTSMDEVLKEIGDGTFLDGFTETIVIHPLPPEILKEIKTGRQPVD